MSKNHSGNMQPQIDYEEHKSFTNPDGSIVNTKSTSVYAYDPATLKLLPLKATDNGDGTLTLNTTGAGGGQQYADGATNATPTGTIALGKDPSNVLHALALDASGNLKIAGTFSSSTAAANDSWGQA